MERERLLGLRLHSHGLAEPHTAAPAAVVARMGAIQAQLYESGKWTIGARAGCTRRQVDDAIANGAIVRTWMMRGTLHFVPSADVRWMLALLTPPIITGSASRVRQLELDDGQFARAEAALSRELRQSGQLTRKQALAVLRAEGLSTDGQRGYALLSRASQRGLIAFGPQQGTQETFVLLDGVAPPGRTWQREEALVELARRYFTSHGPASAQDFARWSGLTLTDTRKAILALGGELEHDVYQGMDVYFATAQPQPTAGALLLAGFDEYVLGYRDRSPVLDHEHDGDVVPGKNGIFQPTLMLDGRVAGTWKAAEFRGAMTVEVLPFQPLSLEQEQALSRSATQYGGYLGLPVRLQIATSADSTEG